MSLSPRLRLPYLQPSQAQKHVTHNEALRVLDALVQLRIVSFGASSPPAQPSPGDAHAVGASPAGAWAGQEGRLALWDGTGWTFHQPRDGWRAWSAAEGMLRVFRGNSWQSLSQGSSSLQEVEGLGIRSTSDPVNRLSVRAPATLLSHDGAGHQLKVNKAAGGDTASLLFQQNFEGRAEMGLAGSNDFSLKVSADGAAWAEALVVDRATGQASFPRGAGQVQLDVFTAPSGTWVKPLWAREVTVVAVGGGGGGGAGARRAAGSARTGGGGGGAGAVVSETFLAGEIGASLTVAVGAGGAGGSAAAADNANGAGGAAGTQTSVWDGTAMILLAAGGSGGAGGSTGAAAGGVGGQNASDLAGGNGAASSGTGATGGAAAFTAGTPGGGGAGGGLNTANAPAAGGAGAFGYFKGGTARRSAGGGAGAAGTASNGGGAGEAKAWARGRGGGGGGGGAGDAAGTLPGGAGGQGGGPGGGGGGGAASTNGALSGAGGAGGRGEVWIIARG